MELKAFFKLFRSQDLSQLVAVNMLYSTVIASMGVLVPLYLLKQNVDLTSIGVILSVAPLTFMVVRMMLASLADNLGTKVISLVYSISNIISLFLYFIASSVFGFSLACFTESVRTAGFWAVARTDILSASSKSKEFLALFSGLRQLADAFGRLFLGLILIYLSFDSAFYIVGFLSLLLFGLICLYKGSPGLKNHHLIKDVPKRIFKSRPKTFWYSAFLLALIALPPNILISYLISVYSKAGLGLGYGEIGTLVALFSLVNAIGTLVATKIGIKINHLLILTSISIPALVLWTFFGSNLLLPLVICGLSLGFSNVLCEYILADQIYRSRDLSTDIGVLYVPFKIVEFVYLIISGFIISTFGFSLLFLILASSVVLFVVLAKMSISDSAHISIS